MSKYIRTEEETKGPYLRSTAVKHKLEGAYSELDEALSLVYDREGANVEHMESFIESAIWYLKTAKRELHKINESWEQQG